MSDEIRELRNEIIALKEIVTKLEGKNTELLKENEALKKQNHAESTNVISTLELDEKQSNDLGEKPKRLAKCIPNWLFEVLAWINRIEMANSKLSTSSWTFKQLCWPKLHLNVKAHEISFMRFYPARYELGNVQALLELKDEVIPIASIPPPNYIVGFKWIRINFADDKILNFVKNITHLIENLYLNFHSETPLISCEMDKNRMASTYGLMEYLADKVYIFIFDGPDLIDFNRIFPGIIDKYKFIKFWTFLGNSNEIDIILNWLIKQPNDGKQKIIKFNYPRHEFMANLICRIKEEFFNSNWPALFHINFIISQYQSYKQFEEFKMENARTNEILQLIYVENWKFYLARYPKSEEHWKKDGQNETEKSFRDFTEIEINL